MPDNLSAPVAEGQHSKSVCPTLSSGGTNYHKGKRKLAVMTANGVLVYETWRTCYIKGAGPRENIRYLIRSSLLLQIKSLLQQSPICKAIMSSNTNEITVTLRQIAKMIDHSLLHPTMTDADILQGIAIAKKYGVATACIKPYAISMAKQELQGTDVLICPVIGFPHGNSSTAVKVFEADVATAVGGNEIDMVINIGKALGGDWNYVADEIRQVNNVVVKRGAILKVIFENDYLNQEHIVRLCKICSDIGVAFVKTSTGYGFVKQANGMYNYKGATIPHLKIMVEESGKNVQVKAAGGVRTLDDLLHVMSLGVTRIGATATVAIMEEAVKRGITDQPTAVTFKPMVDSSVGGY
jgi:deoxyribose-phosphate aldolase